MVETSITGGVISSGDELHSINATRGEFSKKLH